jgi:hypothetical protein
MSGTIEAGGSGTAGEAAAVRGWALAAVAAAGLLFVLGGGWANLRGSAVRADGKIALPVALEPEEGELPTPPTRFRWTPGTPGATAQLVLHRMTYEPLWSSPPLEGGVSELGVPLSAYHGVEAGHVLVWRVREALDGKPLGSSAYVRFAFRVDADGYGPGEAPAVSDYLD